MNKQMIVLEIMELVKCLIGVFIGYILYKIAVVLEKLNGKVRK